MWILLFYAFNDSRAREKLLYQPARQVNELLYEICKLTKRRARRDRTSSRRPSQYLRARIRAIPYGNCIMGRVRRARVMMKPLP
nr:MAG TPA: hypothetical protein [Caudoviricetes sp.]